MKTIKPQKVKAKKSKTIKIKNSSACANFDVIAIPYYLLWYLPEHVDAISDEYVKYLEENLDYIVNGTEK